MSNINQWIISMINTLNTTLYRFILMAILLSLRAEIVFAEENSAEVLIVGAGLSGLSSAYYLKKAGKSAVILEMSPHVGGRIRTATYADNAHAEEIGRAHV